MSISGDTALVGAFGDDDAGYETGSAYIFVRTGNSWSQQAKLTANDAAAHDYFGVSVSISSDTAVIGADGDDDAGDSSGSAYIFVRTGNSWSQQAKLTASDAAAGDSFGESVSISGDTALVGALYDDDGGDGSGSTYVFVRTGNSWSQQAKLTASDGAAHDLFGFSVSISGDTALVGALYDDDGGDDRGSAYVFATAPDLQVAKSNNTSDSVTLDASFNWTVEVSNAGLLAAIFTNGETILRDTLPNTGATYGTPSIANLTNITNGGNINCYVDSDVLLCEANGGSVTLGEITGKFDVILPVTPTQPGILDNPRDGGVCEVDPGNHILESDETNNTCSDSVLVITYDLIITKTNDIEGMSEDLATFNWMLSLQNTDVGNAVFADTQVILKDELPESGANYGTPTLQNLTNITNEQNITCEIVDNVLTCIADGDDVTIGAETGQFEVVIPVTPTQPGTLDNPRDGGICAVDPDNHIPESDETNNTCSDSVTVTATSQAQAQIDSPHQNATVEKTFWTWGWAVDGANGDGNGPGISKVDIYLGDSCSGNMLGTAERWNYAGLAANLSLDNSYDRNAGWSFQFDNLGNGEFTYTICPYSARTQQYEAPQTRTVTVDRPSEAQIYINAPAANENVGPNFWILGWAVDGAVGESNGNGISFVRAHEGDSCDDPLIMNNNETQFGWQADYPGLGNSLSLDPSYDTNSAWYFYLVNRPTGAYTFTICAQSVVTNQYEAMVTRTVNVSSSQIWTGAPNNDDSVDPNFWAWGWALETAAGSNNGPGISEVRLYEGDVCSGTQIGTANPFNFAGLGVNLGLDASYDNAGWAYQFSNASVGALTFTICAYDGSNQLVQSETRTVNVQAPEFAEPQWIESTDSQVAQNGDWTAYESELASGGDYLYSDGENTLELEFSGTSIAVIYVMHPSLGTLGVEVDGELMATVDLSQAENFGEQVVIQGLI